MPQETDNYNLLEEKWIPVLRTNGNFERVGIRKALTEAGSIHQIAASNPMDRVAVLRFLLALLYWCNGNPSDNVTTDLRDSFPSDWFSKLGENRDCFNLLGGEQRFYQCSPFGSARSPEKLSANYLIHEVPTGTNKWHFRHSTDEVDGLCPACCAMGLLRLPLFATSGGRGKPPGINAKPPIYVVPSGESLAETLRLSWRRVSDLGTPVWEKPLWHLPNSGEVPLLTGLTWLARRVWLDNPEESDTACISCGRRDHLIRKCVFAGIGSTKTDEGTPGRTWSDPHVVYTTTSKGELASLHASDALGASDAAAGQCTKIMRELLSEGRAFADRRNAWCVAFATVQNDKYLEAMEYVIPFSKVPHQIEDSVEKIERWQKDGASIVRKLRPPNSKDSSRKQIEIPSMVAAVRSHVESRVCTKACELLTGKDDAWEQAAREYLPMMAVIAKSLSPGFTTAAVQWRKQIAGVVPNMGPKADPTRKTRRIKKGDEK